MWPEAVRTGDESLDTAQWLCSVSAHGSALLHFWHALSNALRWQSYIAQTCLMARLLQCCAHTRVLIRRSTRLGLCP